MDKITDRILNRNRHYCRKQNGDNYKNFDNLEHSKLFYFHTVNHIQISKHSNHHWEAIAVNPVKRH